MKKYLYKIILIVVASSLGLLSAVIMPDLGYAQNTKTTTKSKDGLNFQVPDDWPIEKRNGIVGPIPTEEYMMMKFEKTGEDMNAIKKDYEDKIEALQEKLTAMEEKFNKELADVKTATESPEGEIVLPEGAEARIDQIEKQLGRLDRKITNKVAELKKEYEGKTYSVTKFEKELDKLIEQIKALDGDIEYLYGNVQIK